MDIKEILASTKLKSIEQEKHTEKIKQVLVESNKEMSNLLQPGDYQKLMDIPKFVQQHQQFEEQLDKYIKLFCQAHEQYYKLWQVAVKKLRKTGGTK